MNIYLCSTVRHLLFSLLKGLAEPDNKNIIFMITDQQNIDPANFDRSILPSHVEVIFITRKSLRKKMYSGMKGHVIKQMANFNVKTSPSTREKIGSQLFNAALGLSLTNEDIAQGQLFLFNDRNKMSRLFRLAFERYTLIEEGLANYNGIKLKSFERLNKLITGSQREERYFGDDERCQAIYLINDEQAPTALQNKVKAITFLQNKIAITDCKAFFKMSQVTTPQCILATQPLASTGIDLAIYEKIIHACHTHNISIAIKPHPREDPQRYTDKFPEIQLIESKLPLELIAVDNSEHCKILSIYSTAGMGFEKYCKRINLIKDIEINHVTNIIDDWKNDLSLVNKKVQQLIEDI